MSEATANIILDTRRALKDGTYPVKIRVIYQRKFKDFFTFPNKYSFTKEDYEKIRGPKPRNEFKEVKLKLAALETKANDAIKALSFFTFEGFERKLLNPTVSDDVFDAFEVAIQNFKKNDQIGTAKSYEDARSSLLYYIFKEKHTRNKGLTMVEAKAKRQWLLDNKQPLPFGKITTDFLKDYEKWMVKSGKSLNTVGIYVRYIRALFNEAIATKGLHPDFYPFGKRKYQTPAVKGKKRALSAENVKRIFDYDPKNESEAWARDMWCFTYQCNGINLKDIARLRYEQIDNGYINFIRAKTEQTTRHEQKLIRVFLLRRSLKIIERWGNKPLSGKTLVFPILRQGMSPEKEHATIKQAIKVINSNLKNITDVLELPIKLTTYTARHSFATGLKRAGESTARISDAFGHSTEKTTKAYLDSFEDEALQEMSSNLVDF